MRSGEHRHSIRSRHRFKRSFRQSARYGKMDFFHRNDAGTIGIHDDFRSPFAISLAKRKKIRAFNRFLNLSQHKVLFFLKDCFVKEEKPSVIRHLVLARRSMPDKCSSCIRRKKYDPESIFYTREKTDIALNTEKRNT